MNKRIVLIDKTETDNYASYYGLGLPPENIYFISNLDMMDEKKRNEILELGEGDGALLVGSSPFHYLQSRYHFGVRSENYFDCSKLWRLSIEGGAFVKVILDPPSRDIVEYFLSPDFAKPVDFSWFKHKVLHTYQEVIPFIQWLSDQPQDTHFGFDYEASGFPMDKWFELSGASICTTQFGGFISFTDLRDTCTEDEYKDVLKRLAVFLEARQDHVWVYNMQYEYQASLRMLGVDLYNLCDAGVFNILDGNHVNKKYSLKYTAQMILGASVWDTEFDRISDLIDSMLFTMEGKLKKDMHKVLRVTQENYKETDEWKELKRRYPSHIAEFERLLLKYWGNPFMCIPSDILGHYCNLDAFYTLMLYMQRKEVYTPKAINTFMDNIRLATQLHSCGIPKDEDFRVRYHNYCLEQMAWGITYCATARCKILMQDSAPRMASMAKMNPIVTKLLKDNKFFNGSAIEQLKYILSSNIDEMDAYESGINEGQLLMTYGPEFAEKFMEILLESKDEAKMKTKIDSGVVRRKKLLGILEPKYVALIGLDKVKLDKKMEELEKYLFNERAFTELCRVSRTYLSDINNVPQEIKAFGQTFDLLSYSDFVSNTYFKCKSPIENDQICYEFAKRLNVQSAYLAALMDCVQQLNGGNKFYKNLGIGTIEEGFAHFYQQWKNFVNVGVLGDYPEKMYNQALIYFNDLKSDKVKEVWSNFDGYSIQEQFFPYVSDQYAEYGQPFSDTDLSENFFFMRKLVINYLLYKKYAKILSTYIDGMFLQTDINVIEDPKTHVMIREAEPGEPGAITKMRPRFQCMEKSSKRWSSGYHTIVSHSDIKSVVHAYPGCLLSYFDISSAEVRAAAAAAGLFALAKDPNAKTGLMDLFKKGIDVYINTAKTYLGEEKWNAMTDGERKKWRKNFKTVFLGILYGLGKQSLAERLNCTVEEAEAVIQGVFTAYPELDGYIQSQQAFPYTHNGCLNTMLGDRIVPDEWKYFCQAKTEREKKKVMARLNRLAVNLVIQGGTSTIMSSGFFNDLRCAKQEDWKLTSFITVHDSNTCNFGADRLWYVKEFYDKNFTEYCHDISKLTLLFDLMVGVNYQDVCEFKQIDARTIELKGTAHSILQIMDAMDQCEGLVWESDIPREEIQPKFVTHPVQRFILEKGASMVLDQSKYKVQFVKLS